MAVQRATIAGGRSTNGIEGRSGVFVLRRARRGDATQRRSKPRLPEHADLGEAIRQLRLEAGMNQEQLAERAAADLTQIDGIEHGVRNPSHTTLVRLAKALERAWAS